MNRICFLLMFTLLSLYVKSGFAAEESVYQPSRISGASLEIVNGIPVLSVSGTPEEIGKQIGTLTKNVGQVLSTYPKKMAELRGGSELLYPILVRSAQQMTDQFPKDHLKELQSAAAAADIPPEELIAANVLPDIYRIFGCSSLIVAPENSATGGMLFGRNLDFYTLGMLHRYTLVMVYRPEGKHAFASVGFPGLIGCLSGMNDSGLCLAVHEVYSAKDEAPIFNPDGVPYTMTFRRILEECTTVEEAVELLKATERTTILNLALCDGKSAVVVELTPNSVVVRQGEEGLTACTNHFRTRELATSLVCLRYPKLCVASEGPITVEALWERLDAVNQRRSTLQTMIFEPADLKLHLAFGTPPSSSQEPKTLDLTKLLRPEKEKVSVPRTAPVPPKKSLPTKPELSP